MDKDDYLKKLTLCKELYKGKHLISHNYKKGRFNLNSSLISMQPACWHI